MRDILLFPAGITDSCRYASSFLEKSGIPATDHPTPEITHLLLDIPSFDASGKLRDGSDLNELLRMLPQDITVLGGNLDLHIPPGYSTADLLKDDYFLAKNAAITAECALRAAAPHIPFSFADSHPLVLGWGRIGKHLTRILSAMGSAVTVAARKESDRAMLCSLGYHAVDFPDVPKILADCQLLFNTVPAQPLDAALLDLCKNCIKFDLATAPGMVCQDVIPVRGLPGKYAPESAGRLIAQTVRKLLKEDFS